MDMNTNQNTGKSSGRKGRVLPDLSNEIPTGGGTKPVKASVSARQHIDSPLTLALMETFQPLINALDDIPQIMIESMDSGHDHPSVLDNDLKFLLSGFMSILERKQRGDTIIQKKDANGKVISKNRIYNNKERMDYSQAKADEMKEVLNREDFATLYYKEVNHARYFAYESLLQDLAGAYRQIFNEDWKPVTGEQPKAEPAKKVDDAERNKWAAKLGNKKAA